MFQVLVTEDGITDGDFPVNAQRIIGNADSSFREMIVVVVALVLEYSLRAEHGKAMRETFRDKKLEMVLLGEFHSYVFSVCRASLADIKGDIQDSAPDTSDKFALRIWHLLVMESPDYSVRRLRLIVLHEFHIHSGKILEFLPVETLEEISAVVLEDMWLDYQNAFYVCLYQFHLISLENVPSVYFILHIIQAAVITVGDNGIGTTLELLQAADHLAAEEQSSGAERRFIDYDIGAL